MDKRLSDLSLAQSYDAGHQSLSWVPGEASGLLAGIDIQALIDSPDAKEIVPNLPVQPLYYALKQRGFGDSLEILPFLSDEQVTHMADYETWEGDDFSPKRMLAFLKPFAAVSSEELYRRFSELDEEYQIASLEGIFQVHEVEHIHDLPEGVADRAHPMPCNTVFYEVLSDDKEEVDFIETIMESAREHNMRFAYALLGHTTYNPPGENEAQIAQFRKARLEEDGFVSFEESQLVFQAIDHKSLRDRWQHKTLGLVEDQALMIQDSGFTFFDASLMKARDDGQDVDALYAIHQSLLALANSLCAAARVSVDDLYGLHRVLEQGKALASLGLEYLAGGNLELGSQIILAEHPKLLFQTGFSLIEELRLGTIKAAKRMFLPRAETLERLYTARHWGSMLLEIDRHWLEFIGMEAAEILKGLLNRFPMVAIASPDDAKRITFKPIASRADAYELQLSVQAVLAYFAHIALAGKTWDRPLELIYRDLASASLRGSADDPSEWNVDHSTVQLLDAWRDKLRQESSLWMIGERNSREESLSLAISMMQDCLHGLIVLPETSSSGKRREELI